MANGKHWYEGPIPEMLITMVIASTCIMTLTAPGWIFWMVEQVNPNSSFVQTFLAGLAFYALVGMLLVLGKWWSKYGPF